MSKRLQVVMDEREWRAIARASNRENKTISDWVRHVLRAALAKKPVGQTKRKLETIRAAAQYDFPAPDVVAMNAEIMQGVASGWPK